MLGERTLREQMLLLVALGVIVGMGYLMFRYRPMQRELQSIVAQQTEAEGKLLAIKWPAPSNELASTLESQLAEADHKIRDEKNKVVVSHRKFAPTEEDLRQLNVEIARLAESCRVELREHKPYDPGTSAAAPLSVERIPLPEEFMSLAGQKFDKAKKAEILSMTGPFVDVRSVDVMSPWSLERVTLAGTFTGLHKFVEGLNKLQWRVTVVQIEIDAEKTKDGRNPLLKATMIMGM